MSKGSISVDDLGEIVRAQLGDEVVAGMVLGPDVTLEDLGLASLEVIEMFFAIEELVDCELDPVAASQARTLGELMVAVNAQLDANVESTGGLV